MPKPKTPEEIKEDLIYLYKDYENKIISRHQIIDYVRDLYYIDFSGMIYDDWLAEQSINA